MRKKTLSEEQIALALRDADAGALPPPLSIAEVFPECDGGLIYGL